MGHRVGGANGLDQSAVSPLDRNADFILTPVAPSTPFYIVLANVYDHDDKYERMMLCLREVKRVKRVRVQSIIHFQLFTLYNEKEQFRGFCVISFS